MRFKALIYCLGLMLILIGFGCSGSKQSKPLNSTAFTPLFTGSATEKARQVQRLVTTLTTESPAFSTAYDSATVGFVYTPTCENYKAPLPLSYWTSVDYFGKYAWQIYYSNSTSSASSTIISSSPAVLNVVDTYSATSKNVVPTASVSDPSGTANAGVNLQYERINTANGTDIYDGACYQIALALAIQNGLNSSNASYTLQNYIDAQSHVFSANNNNGTDGNDPACSTVNRAITTANLFNYGGVPPNAGCQNTNTPPGYCGITASGEYPQGVSLTEPSNAYFFRMITQQQASLDPLLNISKSSPEYQQCAAMCANYVPTYTCPAGCSLAGPSYDQQTCAPTGCGYPLLYGQYVTQSASSPLTLAAGSVTWADYKPVTGENVWGILMGPMTAANIGQRVLLSTDPEYVTAKGFLTSLGAMHSKCTGGIYYAAQGSLGNVGSATVNPFQISTENNASTLGALLAFKQALSNMSDPDNLEPSIDTLIWGLNGSASYPTTNSILGYFKYYAWDPTAGYFREGVTEQYDAGGNCTAPFTVGPNAVDANTWSIAALTPKLVDTWFGAGAAYQAWQNVKAFGGYYDPRQFDNPSQSASFLAGVGYSDQDNNGPGKTGGVMSAEWTFGAINLVRSLMSYYGSDYAITPGTPLNQDEASMVLGVLQLHSDNYPTTDLFQLSGNDITTGRPPNYLSYVPTTTINSPGGWFLYASKRYFIPFGWFANPLPSLTSTSWAIMTQYQYNPFNPKGGYQDLWTYPTHRPLGLCGGRDIWFVADNGAGNANNGPGYLTGQAPFGNSSTLTSYPALDQECLRQAARLNPQFAAYDWKSIFLLPTGAEGRAYFLHNSDGITTFDPANSCNENTLTLSSGNSITIGSASFPNRMLYGSNPFHTGSFVSTSTNNNCAGGTATSLSGTAVTLNQKYDSSGNAVSGEGSLGYTSVDCDKPFNMLCAAQYLPSCATDSGMCSGATPHCDASRGTCACIPGSCPKTTPTCGKSTGECQCTKSSCPETTPNCNSSTKTCQCDRNSCTGTTPLCANTGGCAPCTTSSNVCTKSTPICNQITGACQAKCTASNGLCTGNTPVCTSTGACAPCTPSLGCSNLTPVCNMGTGACASCTTDPTICKGTTPACAPSSGACTSCSQDPHVCSVSCNLTTGACNQ